jgi:prepilin-type N-terminal cleavage/methylation domain-containing protein
VLRRLAKSEGGFSLVELLIAMAVMSIGITAIVAGYSSGILAVDRAKAGTTAGALADRQMEAYRQGSFAAVPAALQAPTTPNGYWMQVDGTWSCAIGTYVAGPPQTCTSTPLSRPVKVVTINVRQGSGTGKLLFTETSTFDSSTG